MSETTITVVGAGLAGAEAAWQIASHGVPVRLIDMKPDRKSPAHQLDTFAELVCSNSLRSGQTENAAGLLKEELRHLHSLILSCADATAIPAGGALAVDRVGFTQTVTERLCAHPLIRIEHREITEIPNDDLVVIATGPLTSDALAADIARLAGSDGLFFFDAAAPIVAVDSLDMSKVFRASRYGKGSDDYLNCPMNREEYLAFHQAVLTADAVELEDFEPDRIFEGCLPIESMARRGIDTMRYGPMKPVGLVAPRTGEEPYAVVQLRQDDKAGTLYNLVGFQTHLKWGEQKRVFGMIPGLESARFERYGVMHRNTFLDSPRLLNAEYGFRTRPGLYFAGQMTGVEGYVESAASGWLAGTAAAMRAIGKAMPEFPDTTAVGALARWVSTESTLKFQPMNINFGIMAPLGRKVRSKRDKNTAIAARALEVIDALASELTATHGGVKSASD